MLASRPVSLDATVRAPSAPVASRQGRAPVLYLLVGWLACCWSSGCVNAARSTLRSETEARIGRVLANLVDPVLVRGELVRPTSLQVRMAEHRVPAVSLAVVDGNRLAWVRAL